ncbi:MAG: hypothetical protein FD170_2603 [Bacteroidetes bacterium]|nr:MAG: hypothetical protein FD170_2603 [Bacteroidota bacterium]
MKYILVSLVLILLVSFSAPNPSNEFDTKLYRKHFTEQERLELFKIVSFVDSIVLSQNRFSEIDKAYQYYYDSICELYESSFEVYPSIDEEEKLKFLFNLDTELFNKIWSKQIPRFVRTNDTILYSPVNFYFIDIYNNGEYVKLLKKLGKTNRYYKQVHKDILLTGAFSPIFYGGFFDQYYNFDFDYINDRLFFSIVLLTTEEPIETKVKRYITSGAAHNN